MGKITLNTVKAIRPGEIVWDSEVKGFGLRCQKGSKRYILKTRVRGRVVWFTIGDVGAWTPTAARDEAKRLLRELAVKDVETLRRNPRGLATVNDLLDRYVAEHLEKKNRPSTAARFKMLLKKHIRPALGKRAIVDVTSADVAKLHHAMRRRPRSANMVLAVISKAFNLAETPWKLRPPYSNPCRGIERFAEVKRERFLSDAELVTLGATLDSMEKAGEIAPGFATVVRLLALTGCRVSEILKLRWSDVDVAAGSLSIRDAKTEPRKHPIGAATIALLGNLARDGVHVAWAFDPKEPIKIDAMEKAWAKIRKRAGLDGVRLHDLKHGYGTFSGQTGANAFLIRDALAHKTIAMSSRYVNKSVDPLRQLADRVSSRIGAALAGKEATVEDAPAQPKRGAA